MMEYQIKRENGAYIVRERGLNETKLEQLAPRVAGAYVQNGFGGWLWVRNYRGQTVVALSRSHNKYDIVEVNH